MSDEAAFWREAAHNVVQNFRENPDDAIALEVAVAVVVLLEVIEVGVASGEELARGETDADRRFDLRGAREAGGRMHVHVAIGATKHHVEADRDLVVGGVGREHLIGAGSEALRERGLARAHEHPRWDDARVRIALEPNARGAGKAGLGARVEDDDVRPSPKRHRYQLIHGAAEDGRQATRVEPMPCQLRERSGIGGEIDGWTLGHATKVLSLADA